jgi:hypothetical protein
MDSQHQHSLFAGQSPAIYLLSLERRLSRLLDDLQHWNDGASPTMDWQLEATLDELRELAVELRRLKNEDAIPF